MTTKLKGKIMWQVYGGFFVGTTRESLYLRARLFCSITGSGRGLGWSIGAPCPLEFKILTLILLALHGKNEAKSTLCPRPPLVGAVPPPESHTTAAWQRYIPIISRNCVSY